MNGAYDGRTSPGPIHQFLADDHRRIEGFLAAAATSYGEADIDAYNAFRSSLLRHIGMEEKILLPAVRTIDGGIPADLERRIRLDHGAIAALLVPPPLPQVVNALRAILSRHDALEEDVSGLYEVCDGLVTGQASGIIDNLRRSPAVRLAPGVGNPNVLNATRRALERAGYNFDDYR